MAAFGLLADTPLDLIENLKRQTEHSLAVQNITDLAYFKFVYLDEILTTSSVLSEFHIAIDWNTNGQVIRERLRDIFGGISSSARIDLYFAGREFNDASTLASMGATYADKIYFNIGSYEDKRFGQDKLAKWSGHFRKVAQAIADEPTIYANLADTVCKKLGTSTLIEHLNTDDWRGILSLRNLCGVFANAADGTLALSTTQRLIQALNLAMENQNIGGVYHLVNVLEWLSYIKTRMFEGIDLLEGHHARRALAQSLLNVIDPDHSLPSLVRMEAAWAIGWASVASQDFGREVYEQLIEYESREPVLPVNVAIRSAALRSLLYPSPYYMAAMSQVGGWFKASVLDQNEFRRVAISGRRDDVLRNFRTQLESVLPPASRRDLP